MSGVAGAAGEGNGVIEATEGAELVQSSPEDMVAVPEAEADVSFAFYLLQGSGPSAGGRRAQGQGWLQVNTWQLGASLTLSAAFEAAWCEGCGDMDFYTMSGERINSNTELIEIPLPWFVEGISVAPRRRARSATGSNQGVQEVPSSEEEEGVSTAKKACRRKKDKKKKKKKEEGEGLRNQKEEQEASLSARFACCPLS